MIMKTGRVKWFNEVKGFGFIEVSGGDADVFVHISEVKKAGYDTLAENDKVSFEVEAGRSGKTQAGKLKLLAAGA